MDHQRPRPAKAAATFTNINAGQSTFHNTHTFPAMPPVPSILDALSSKYAGSYSNSDLQVMHLLPIFTSKYQVLDELGIGGTSFVRLARDRDTGKEVAVKILYKEMAGLNGWMRDPESGRVLPMEIALLRKLRHNHIIRFIEFFEDTRFFYLITESHGSAWSRQTKKLHKQPSEKDLIQRPDSGIDLKKLGSTGRGLEHHHYHHHHDSNRRSGSRALEVILADESNHTSTTTTSSSSSAATTKKRSSRDLFECLEQNSFLSEEQVWKIFRQVASSIHYLHCSGIVHRDIKDENVLIDENLVVKLIDFGGAQPIPRHPSQWFRTFNGTVHYQSPEALRQIPHDGKSSDVWALGVLLYILAFGGEVPFADALSVCEGRILQPRYKRSPNLMNLLNLLLEPDHLRRVSMEQVMIHEWIRGCHHQYE